MNLYLLFQGIVNLTYLDISDNQLTVISSEAFKPLVKLSVLRLRGNLLKVPALVSLKVRISLLFKRPSFFKSGAKCI